MTTDMRYESGAGPVPFPVEVVEINGEVYVQVEKGVAIDQLGLSTVKAMEQMMPPPDLPQPPLPGYVLVDINTFMKVAAATGALSGVSAASGRSLIDPEAFALGINNDMHKIIISVLTSWSEAVQKQGEEMKKADEIADIKKAEDKHDQLLKDIRAGQVKSMEAYAELVKSGEATQPVFVMGSLALGPTVMTVFVGESGSRDVALNVTVKAISDIGGTALTSGAAALGFLGTAMMYGIQVLANLSRLGAEKGAKLNEKVPEEYAKKTLSFVNSRDADVLLKAAAGKGKDADELVAMVKVAMLVLPLMLNYRFETGGAAVKGREGMTSFEMKSLLLQEFKDIPKDDIKSQLAANIQRYLGQISGPVKALLLERILAYVDSKPALGELLDAQKAIEKIKTIEETNVETFGV